MGRTLSRVDQPASRRVADQVREMIRARRILPGGRLPTYHELCKELGVSYVTVKRGMDVLEAEDLVRRIPSKGSFVTKDLVRTPRPLQHVGLICPASRQSLFTHTYLIEIMRGISLASPPQTDLHIFSMREEGLVGAAQLAEWNVDGVILLGVENDDYLRTFATWGTPGVVADYCAEATPLDYVACDNRAAANRIVEYLWETGHRRVVACMARPTPTAVLGPAGKDAPLMLRFSSDMRERREESLRALLARDMLVETRLSSMSGPHWVSQAAQTIVNCLRKPGHPTAIVTESDYSADLLLRELGICGVRVPGDLVLCAVGGAGHLHGRDTQTCTHCRFDFVGMGRTVMELLAARCSGPTDGLPRGHRIGFEFMEGATSRRTNPSFQRGK